MDVVRHQLHQELFNDQEMGGGGRSCTQWKQGHIAKNQLRRIAHDGGIDTEAYHTKLYTAGIKHKRQSGNALKCIRCNNVMGERRVCYLKGEGELLQVTEKAKVFLLQFGCFILYKEVN